MKIALSIISIFLFFISLNAQSKTISKDEYEKVFQFAESRPISDYPVIFKVITEIIDNGKTSITFTDITESESKEHSRQKRTVLENGRETTKYQVDVGYGNTYCSDDGLKWKGPFNYGCRNADSSGPREPESAEYSVDTKTVDGKKIRVYREYLVLPPFSIGEKKDFLEKFSTIDSRGFLINIEDTEGTLDPKTITLTRKQSWVTKAKIKPITAPIKLSTNK